MSKSNDNFTEIIAGHFHDILRASGVAMMRVDSHEKIRDASRRMALSIEHRAEQEAIKIFKRLQAAVVDGFNNMENDIKELKEVNKELVELTRQLSEVNKIQTTLLENHSRHLDILNQYGEVRIVQEGGRLIPSVHKGPNPTKTFIRKDSPWPTPEIHSRPEPAFDFEEEDEDPA
jgi:hypothetical protein